MAKVRTSKRKSGTAKLWARIRDLGVARLGLALIIGLVGGSLAFGLALSGVQRNKHPQRVLSFMPWENAALVARADQILLSKDKAQQDGARRLALASLRQQALNPSALRVLGFYEEIQGRSGRAALLVERAASLSRREGVAQFWLIENAVRNNKLDEVLSHYDVLLLTKPDSKLALFPTLMAGIEDPSIRTAFAPYIKSKKPWVGWFFGFAILNTNNLSSVVSLLSEGGGFPLSVESPAQAKDLMARLANAGQFEEAHRVFLMMPGTQAGRLTDASFRSTDIDGQFGVMGWQAFSDADAGASFTRVGPKGPPLLTVFASSSTTKMVARKLLFLPAGKYHFDSRQQNDESGNEGRIGWRLTCTDGQPIWAKDAVTPNMADNFEVAAGCPHQYLELIVSGEDGQSDFGSTISDLKLSVRAF